MEFILTGEPITAVDMERYGIVNKAVPAEQDVVKEAIEIATRIATFSAATVGLAKQAIKTGEQPVRHMSAVFPKHAQPKQRHWKQVWNLSVRCTTAVSRLQTVKRVLQRFWRKGPPPSPTSSRFRVFNDK